MRTLTPNLQELTEQLLLAKHTPTAIVVNARGDMHYVHGRTDRFLEHTTGEIGTNILKIAREGLRLPIAKALYDLSLDRGDVEVDRIVLRQDDEIYGVKLSISRINNPAAARDMFLITLAETNVGPTNRAENFKTQEELWNHVQRLENELDYTREHLQATITQYEAANEHLAHANGDLRSSNEKLHRANEELQASKEELQSVNEELCIVNDELRHKLTETVRASNDIKNLLDNSEIRMIFLDLQLCIRRFTRGATEIVRLVDSDIGRPLDHFAHRLGYDHLHDDIREVLATLEPKALELQTLEKHWYLARILPYRTMDEEVDGIVLTFTDVTLLKETNKKLEFLFDVLPVGISLVDQQRTSFKHNAAFLRMCDLSSTDAAERLNLRRRYYRPDGTERSIEEFAASRVLAGEKAVLNIESGFRRANGEMTWLDVSAVACPFKDWSVIVVTADVTARRNAENALKNSEEKFSRIFHHAPLLIALIDIETMTLVDCNQRFLDVSGYARHEVIGTRTKALDWMPGEAALKFLDTMSKHGFTCNEEVVCRAKDGRGIDCLYNGFILEIGGKRQVVSMIQDVSELNRSEKIRSTLRKEKETVLRELAHRTKNNMFVIRSMLNLHAMHTQNDEVHRLVTDVENKILAMALVHQKLYQSNNLSRVDLGEYLRELAPALMGSLAFAPNRIAFDVDAESISALIDIVIPCGLVVTELISNSFKYAFPDGRKGKISVHLHRKSPETIHLHVADDGVGVNPHFDFRGQTTLGLQTVFMIVEHQLKGTIKFGSSEHGLMCDIEFADTLYSERV
jgi:PAS domain S-box-containing protein